MAEYSELIKRFDKIRDYMREFYVYGFKTRKDFETKSLRTYDNEKRRIESYLGELMAFRQGENGKNVFISLDSASISHNPLYRAFKAKTFTKNDISLHFILLDILSDKSNLTAMEIADIITKDYMSFFKHAEILDLSTVRNKIKEYEKFGIITSKKEGKKLLYSLSISNINVNNFYNALSFFSEVSPIGVIGSYLMDKVENENKYITFKHHYIMNALDSEITLSILDAMNDKRDIEVESYSPRRKKDVKRIITPLKLLISVRSGRRYICGFDHRQKRFANSRIDYIKTVKPLYICEDFDMKKAQAEEILDSTWGISLKEAKKLERVEIIFNIKPKEQYIVERINREKCGGVLSQIDENTYKYEVEVFDAREMITWVRTFIGRIKSFECSNKKTEKVFYEDLKKMYEMYEIYGGETDAI